MPIDNTTGLISRILTKLSTLNSTAPGYLPTSLGSKTAANSFAVALASDQLPLSTSNESSTIYNGTTALTPKFAFVNIAASQTASSVVAAVTAKKIRVLAIIAQAGATATNITFNSASTAKTMLFANGANGGEVLPFNPVGWFETVAGEALTATTGAGSTTGIQVVYIEV